MASSFGANVHQTEDQNILIMKINCLLHMFLDEQRGTISSTVSIDLCSFFAVDTAKQNLC